MTDKIHIYIYYNILYQKSSLCNNYDEKIMTSEVTIISDEKIVKEIMKNSKSSINEYGEFINYDGVYLKKIILDDINNYKEKSKSSVNWDFTIDSFYYVKCELKKDISNKITNFIN